MTRGMRLLIVFCVFVLVIVLMMDCAKKSMRKKHTVPVPEGESHGWIVPDLAPADPRGS